MTGRALSCAPTVMPTSSHVPPDHTPEMSLTTDMENFTLPPPSVAATMPPPGAMDQLDTGPMMVDTMVDTQDMDSHTEVIKSLVSYNIG